SSDLFLPAAQAAPGTVTTNVNVRSGPGTSYAVVDVARAGQQVDVQQCQGSWCYISKPGPDGWVSANYLRGGVTSGTNPGQPSINFGINVPGGPSINFGVGNQPQPPRPGPRPPVVSPFAEVCFFDRTRFRGDSFCLDRGESVRNLGSWSDRISSIENTAGIRVEVCSET